jgi:hypothetical protein
MAEENNSIILVATPVEVEDAGFYFDVCDNCLAHGYDGIFVTIDVKEVIFGEFSLGQSRVSATNGFLFHTNSPKGRNRHLFVLKRKAADAKGELSYHVAEADPIYGKVCTLLPIEDYISGAADWSLEAAFTEGEHCYSLAEIKKLGASTP